MAQTSSPTAWRRWLAFELRRLREEAGLSQREAGKAFSWSGARVSYVENAQQPVVADDLEKLLPHYGVPEDRWPTYFEAAERSRGRGWWERYGRDEVPGWLSLYFGLEQGATEMRVYEVTVIHGLLQTPAYADAVFRSDVVPRTDAQVGRLVELRIARQAALTREESPLTLSVVLDEAALRRGAGDRASMAAQLDHLAEMAERPNVAVRVLPFERGVYGWARGPFAILGFPWPNDPGVVYMENRTGAVYLEARHEVDAHTLVFQHLCSLALSPDESIALIRAVSKEAPS